eukprot:5668546-Pleurochrysis_carterae.AAC.1
MPTQLELLQERRAAGRKKAGLGWGMGRGRGSKEEWEICECTRARQHADVCTLASRSARNSLHTHRMCMRVVCISV